MRADSDGSFRICVPEQSAALRIVADGYGAGYLTVGGDASDTGDATLLPESAILGTVVLGTDGSPVPNATVAVRALSGAFIEVSSGPDGRFVAEPLAPGTYDLRARAPKARYRQPVRVRVAPGTREEVLLPVDPRATVRGTVRTGSEPVADARVWMLLSGTEQRSGESTTDREGRFTLFDAPPGPASVVVVGYEVRAPLVVQVPAEGLPALDVEVEPRARLEVHVSRDERPVRGAWVRLSAPAENRVRSSDARGIATFLGLNGGSHRVRATHEGGFATADAFPVAAGEQASLRLVLGDGANLAGQVLDTAGMPVEGAWVALNDVASAEDRAVGATTDASGRFRGGPLFGPATYRASVFHDGVPLRFSEPAPQVRVPAEGAPDPAELRLVVEARTFVLAGAVRRPSGEPAADVRVTLHPQRLGTAPLRTAFTGMDGAFAFQELSRGPFRLVAQGPDGGRNEREIPELPQAPALLVLDAVAELEGFLEGFASAPVVMAWTRSSTTWDTLHYATVEGERFRFEGLAPDAYFFAGSTNTQAVTAEVELRAGTNTELTLTASGSRRVRGAFVDFRTGRGFEGSTCRLTPDVAGARSPVVVPGAARTDAVGEFELLEVPTAPLNAYCEPTTETSWGAGRLPAGDGDGELVVYGLDVSGRPALDIGALGFAFLEEQPFAHVVATVVPDGPAAGSGLQRGDIVARVGDEAMNRLGNATVREYLALLLTEQAEVGVVVLRSGEALALRCRLR